MKVKQGQRFVLWVFDNIISFGRFKILWIFRNLSIQILEIRGQTISRFTIFIFLYGQAVLHDICKLKKAKTYMFG